MKNRKLLFISFLVVLTVILFNIIISLKDTWTYRLSCILCNITDHNKTFYSRASISPDSKNVAYFKTQLSFIETDPMITLFIGDGSDSKKYYKYEKISVCTNDIGGGSEICPIVLREKTNNPAKSIDFSKFSLTPAPIFWDKNGDVIYGYNEGFYTQESVFKPTFTVVSRINMKLHQENVISNQYIDYQKLWFEENPYRQDENPNKILVSGENFYNGGNFGPPVYLIDTVAKNVSVYIVDPKLKPNFIIPKNINYEFFKNNLNDKRLK